MASNFKDDMNGHVWEAFCEKMLRHEYGWKAFTTVPHLDRGDHGIEFFTSCGTIFQCYFPDPAYSMKEYKLHIQKKIREDLEKLNTNKVEILKLLGDITISHWVLLIPHMKSRDLIKYCNTQEKKVIPFNLPFISNSDFQIKIETDDSFPSSSLYARNFINTEVNIDIKPCNEVLAETWKSTNSNFYNNICRKTLKIDSSPERLKTQLINNYLQVEELLDAYRDQFPDLHLEITSHTRANLEELRNDNLFTKDEPSKILSTLQKMNRSAFEKINTTISNSNKELVSTGLIAQWIAECKMDFIIDE
jgi:hypothetical protein